MSKKQQPIIVGLDIGTTKVVAIAGRKNEYGKLEILGFGRADSEGVNHGVVINIEQCVHSVELAIKRCFENNPDLTITEVYVGIAGKHIKSMQAQGSRVRANVDTEISKDDIEQLLRDQYKTYLPTGDQIIDIIPQDYTVDNIPDIIDPVGMSGVKIGANFHVITGDSTAIRNMKRCVDRSNLKTCDLILQPLASAAAVMNDEDMEAGVAIVDIGGGTTDMAVFCDGILKHTAVIPYAGVNITNDILTGLRVLRSQAEQMKVQFGTALGSEANRNSYITIPGLRGLPAKEVSVVNLANIIQARMEEILDYVMFNIRQIGLEHRLNGGIILTGGGARLKHITQLTEYVTGMGARIGYPNEHLAGGYNDALMSPMYSTCIGLILRGYYDYESGRTEFYGNGGNYLRVSVDQPVMQEIETIEEPVQEISDEVAANNKWEKFKKRQDTMKELFDRLRGKFMDLFEDIDDKELK
ncbi:MAG: cell division protein FtsA [Chitinophagaceae bacterium]|nr:cell division protein FtsA [Chitinophagaceae bacterium]